MNIANIVNQINNAFSNNVTADNTVATDKAINSANLKNGIDTILNLNSGSIISGEIVSVDNENLVLKLSDNQLLNALIKGDVVPSKGQIMSFLVNNGSDSISLSPMYVNTSFNSNISNALLAANIEDNPSNQYMVQSLMEEGLPIDKNSILEMSHLVKQFQTVDPKDIAVMLKLDIPITENMVEQFENYKNYEHQITNSIKDISDSYIETLNSMIETEEPVDAANFLKNSLSLFADENTEVFTKEDLNGTNLSGNSDELVKNSINADSEVISSNIRPDDNSINDINKGLTFNKNSEVFKELVNTMEKLPDSMAKTELLKDGNINPNDKASFAKIADAINDALKDVFNKAPEEVKDILNNVKTIFNNEIFKDALKQNAIDKWMLKPEEVSDKNNIRELYDRLNNQLKEISNEMLKSIKQDTPLQNAINSTTNNIEFMNELNQTFNYIQIPLKFANQEAAGDLYVYSNKKSLASNDGNISALLHLDMDNLGPLDVHVLLNEMNNVKTKFYLKDDEALDLIASNIDTLNERLNNRGYNMNAEFINKNEDSTIFEKMTSENSGMIVSHTSFDARA